MTGLLIAAAFTGLWTASGVLAVAVVLGAGALARWRADRDDLEALIDATRENIPDHVPDEWVRNT